MSERSGWLLTLVPQVSADQVAPPALAVPSTPVVLTTRVVHPMSAVLQVAVDQAGHPGPAVLAAVMPAEKVVQEARRVVPVVLAAVMQVEWPVPTQGLLVAVEMLVVLAVMMLAALVALPAAEALLALVVLPVTEVLLVLVVLPAAEVLLVLAVLRAAVVPAVVDPPRRKFSSSSFRRRLVW
jgi:hypothetical protein